MGARDFIHEDHPEQSPCPWRYLTARCVLVRAHPTPHWLEVEQPRLPSAKGAIELLAKEKARGSDEDE